jgi:hypothetical protein
MNTPTQLVVTKLDNSTDVLTITAGSTFQEFWRNVVRAGGYWTNASGTTPVWTPMHQIKSVTAS